MRYPQGTLSTVYGGPTRPTIASSIAACAGEARAQRELAPQRAAPGQRAPPQRRLRISTKKCAKVRRGRCELTALLRGGGAAPRDGAKLALVTLFVCELRGLRGIASTSCARGSWDGLPSRFAFLQGPPFCRSHKIAVQSLEALTINSPALCGAYDAITISLSCPHSASLPRCWRHVALDGCRSIGVGGGVAAVRPSEVGVCAILDAVTW